MSLKKKYDQIKAEEAKEAELVRRQKEKDAALKAAEDARIRQISEHSLAQALKELDVKKRLREIRDDFWKIGEIKSEIVEKGDRWVKSKTRLEAHEEDTGGWDGGYWVEAHTSEHTETVRIEVLAEGEDVSIWVDQYKVDYTGPADIKRVEDLLLSYCLRNAERFPLTKEKDAKRVKEFKRQNRKSWF
jgi:hypothetical protein